MASKEAEEYVFPEKDRIERNKYLESLDEKERIIFNIQRSENAKALRYSLEDIRQVKLDAFDAGVESERQRHKWHNVKIELPKETRNYLVSYDENCKHSFHVIHYEADDWYGWYGEGSEEIVLKPYWWKEIE